MPFKITEVKELTCNLLIGAGLGATGAMEVLKRLGYMYSQILPTFIGTITLGLLLYKVYGIIKTELKK